MAAANAADKNGDPPPVLVRAWQCERWTALPNPGGLRDQPVREMADMTATSNVYTAIRQWKSSGNWANFQKNNPVQWRIVSHILKMRRGLI